MNAVINIRSSFIQIDDTTSHESIKTIKKSELIFSENHNLLMYSKSGFSTKSKKRMKSYVNESDQNDDDEFDDESDDFENNLSNVEKMSTQQNFR